MAPAAAAAAASSDSGLPLARYRGPGLGPHGLPGCSPRCPPRPSEMSEARTRGRSPRCPRWGPPGGPAESAGSSGARRVPGALSRERAVSWSRTPVGRRAGLRRGAEAGAGAGAGGGAARLPGPRAATAVAEGGGGAYQGERLDRSARS
ncbi:translation initiation factor IF-2-like [Zalophus californianus]|uniref:Translation initiation factor IF-2-like n=1 Tax=Zalophus californianus TaxID=9704 RepID=A0A6P9EZM6_ZALCA|nr:translation initiation factor IF-2-like [Zalophus californianus]